MRHASSRKRSYVLVVCLLALAFLLLLAGGERPSLALPGTTERVSVDSAGAEGGRHSWGPAISADGRYVAFHSRASNLVPDDTNSCPFYGNGECFDVFVHDRQTSTTERVSVDSTGNQSNGLSSGAAVSADGRYVAFSSYATDLVPGDTNDHSDVFVHDRQTGTTERVSIDSAGNQGDDDSHGAAISADGRYVAFGSWASSLVPGDTNACIPFEVASCKDVFVHDRQTGTTIRASVASDGSQGNKISASPAISGDGRYVAFGSSASNLVPGDTNNHSDVFVHDRQTGTTVRVSVASDGSQANNRTGALAISADGRYVTFESDASNLVLDDINGKRDIFVHDRQTGITERVSVDSAGSQGNNESDDPAISADGRYVAFQSAASNLVADHTSGGGNIFVHDRQTQTTVRVSIGYDGGETDDHSETPAISADGRYVAFGSYASNLVPGDTNSSADIFVFSLAEICDDGIDNDGDTLVDCDDPDCDGDPACEEVQEVDLSVETVDSSNEPGRVFKSGGDVFIRLVLRNIGDSTVTGDLKLEIRDENDKLINEEDELPSEHISLAPGELKVHEDTWNSGKHAEWTDEEATGGFKFIGKKFRIGATFAGAASTFDFYVDEFGVDKSFRSLNYFVVPWEDVWAAVKKAKDGGTDVRQAWKDEWNDVAQHAQSLGANVFDIGMHWYSYGYDESCIECLGCIVCDPACLPLPCCPLNVKPLSYWFPADDGKNGYYSTPPMSGSVRRENFGELGISDPAVARQMIRDISDIAHSHGMKVAIYTDPMALYDPDHSRGCSLSANSHVNEEGWTEGNERLSWCECDILDSLGDLATPDEYGVVASPSGTSSTPRVEDHSAFSPSEIDKDLNEGEDWDDPNYHYHIVKQFRWLVKNYDFDIFFVDDTGRLMSALGAGTGPGVDSDETCKVGSPFPEIDLGEHPAEPSESCHGFYDGEASKKLKQRLETSLKSALGDDDFTIDESAFTLDVYANMLRHMRWQLKEPIDDADTRKRALFSSDYFVPWKSLVASEDASSTDKFVSNMGAGEVDKGCHILWSEQTYDMGFKPMRPAHYLDPVNRICIGEICTPRDARVVAGWTWAVRGINLFNYPGLSPYPNPDEWKPDPVATDLINYLKMYNDNTEVFANPNLDLDSADKVSLESSEVGVLVYSSPQRPDKKRIVIHAIHQKSDGSAVGKSADVKDVLVPLPPETETDHIKVKLLTGDLYNEQIETDLKRGADWKRCDLNRNQQVDGEYICIDVPVKVYSVVVVDVLTTPMPPTWDQVCYLGSEQPIEDAVSAGVQAVYRLAPGGGFERWFPGRPEVSNIVTLDPYDALFVLVTDGASWIPEPSGTPPASVNLAQGWNSVCYTGSPEPPEHATSSIAEHLAVLYGVGSDQTWGRYVPGRPALTNISLIDRYSAVLLLVTGDTTWTMPGVSDHATPSPTPTPSPSPTPSPTPTPTPTPTATPSPTETPTPSPTPTPSSYTGTLTVDRGTGATYLGGEEITICYSLSPPTPFHFKLFKKPEGESWTLVDQWDDDGTGWCFAATVSSAELGRKDLRAEFWISGQKVAEASTYIFVVAA